ncbi:ABC transporter family substrate-binding protein [Streptomyces poriticola]|uniref:ABC transporter family substrate-binding protein n=1 Tax=Streptomyces poriticola TaxID=3120506 RepID=UPI002FCE1F6F
MSHVGVGPRAVKRSVAFLTAGVLAVPVLAGCSSEDPAGAPLAGPDIAAVARARVADGGTLRWAVDSLPDTLNTFQADADATTTRVAQAVLPSMYRMDASGRPVRNADYLESAEVVETEPKQVVLYKLNQQAVWSDGREIGAADFAAQWRALSGRDTAYWTARNAGYDRIEKIERGANNLEVKVTFSRPYADWTSLFTPLYPKEVMGTPDAFNDGARRKLKTTAGPFGVGKVDRDAEEVVLTRNPRWWGEPAKLTKIVLKAVPSDERVEALVEGTVDLAEIGPGAARKVRASSAPRGAKRSRTPLSSTPYMGPGGSAAAEALRSWAVANGSDADAAHEESLAREERRAAVARADARREELRRFEVRSSLEPAYTQLALNGADGPLADERVRRAVARAIDREKLAEAVLGPLGLPTEPVGSHLALSGQAAYADGSGALGGPDVQEARALLADAGWVPGGPVKEQKKSEGEGEDAAGAEGERDAEGETEGEGGGEEATAGDESPGGDDGTYIVGQDDKPGDGKPEGEGEDKAQGSAPGAYAPKGTAAPGGGPQAAPLAKDGQALTLRFVVPSGPGSESLRTVAERISRMLKRVGISTDLTKVADASYFKDHVASGQYDLALYSWPASAYPATDARPIYRKPVPAADGSLNVGQNYTRVGTDQVDQLFEQALGTLDEGKARDLLRKADSRIWAAAGSLPLYQRPQLSAARKNLANAGAFGFETPVYEDMGFLKKGTAGSRPSPADD